MPSAAAAAHGALDDAEARRLLAAAIHGRIGELRKCLRAQPERLNQLFLDRDGATAMTAPGAAGAPAAPAAPGPTTLLCAAAAQAQHGAVETLIENGALVDLAAADGRTPLMHAASHADRGLLAVLLAARADPLMVDALGWDAAEYARHTGRQRREDATWERCVAECVALLDERCATRRRELARLRWRCAAHAARARPPSMPLPLSYRIVDPRPATYHRRCGAPLRRAIWIVILLADWHARAAERAYAPGGVGCAAHPLLPHMPEPSSHFLSMIYPRTLRYAAASDHFASLSHVQCEPDLDQMQLLQLAQ
jgi:hypothetical protein